MNKHFTVKDVRMANMYMKISLATRGNTNHHEISPHTYENGDNKNTTTTKCWW